MDRQNGNYKTIAGLMLKLLPIQILFVAVGSVNGIISSYFATNFVGVDAMSAVGLYGPVNMLISAFSTIFVGGAAIVCGKYIGQNDKDKVRGAFSVDIVLSMALSVITILILVFMVLSNLTIVFTNDETVRHLFNQYIIGQAIGIIPFIIGNQLTVFLSIENRQKLSIIATVAFIISNYIFNYLIVQVLKMQAFGLSLASSLGMWVFCLVESLYFISGKSYIAFSFRSMQFNEVKEIIAKGFPGALAYIYQSFRGIIVNGLIIAYIGSAGISAFATANNLMQFFWAVPGGMAAVSRLLISIGIGEEDRKTLTNVMQGMFKRYFPMQCLISLFVIILSVPFTGIFYKDPSMPVYMMTVWGFRILPICMPLTVICMHFTCYAQASGKNVLINLISAFDGLISVAVFSAILIRPLGMNAIYVANVLNGVVSIIIILTYSIVRVKHWPQNMDELMVIPVEFGVADEDVVNVSVNSMEDVTNVAAKIQSFYEERGFDHRRASLAGLSMEEMAGNIVEHGFTKDKKKHSVDIRAIYKNDEMILRIKDDCIAFDPATRNDIIDPDDITRNIGIRMIYKLAKEINYQNVLGLNVLTVKL
ncbi:MATE family efflux transporter [Butyrivibrio sp. WCE2006]|uniref:MATE family efflux transporter n=1 Tax=Butyrivibrio sp. WCE2006 TaxID=1410611 RepID=UPI0005D1A76F|nr:MATE family efflux transporter [Butyrivibrio sp. WCE2006]